MQPSGRQFLYILAASFGVLVIIVTFTYPLGAGPVLGRTDNGRGVGVSTEPTTSDAVEPRQCAFVDSQKQITVGQESAVTLNLEECVQEVLQRVMADKNMKVRELILTGKLYADASLVSFDNAIVIRQRGRNGIQPLRPQPSWLWTVEATHPGRHEVVVEIRTIGPDNDPGVFLSPPITLSMTAVQDVPATTTSSVAQVEPPQNPQPEHGNRDDNEWTAPVIIGLVIAAIAAVFAITGPVRRKRREQKGKAAPSPVPEPAPTETPPTEEQKQ